MNKRISTPQNFLFSSIVCFKSLFDNWGIIIHSLEEPEFTQQRRNAVCIWVNALIEYWKRKNERSQCFEELKESSLDLTVVENTIDVFDNFTFASLSGFTEEEQVAFWYIRNSALHGHLTLHFRDDLYIPVFDSTNKVVKKIKRTRKDFETAFKSITYNPTDKIRNLNEFNHLLVNYDYYLQNQAMDKYSEALFGQQVSHL